MARLQEFNSEIQALNKSLEAVKKQVLAVLDATKALDQQFQTGATNQKGLSDRIKQTNTNLDILAKSEQELQKIQKQTSDTIAKARAERSEENKQLIKAQEARKDQNAKIKEGIKLQQAEQNSISRLIAENKKLRKERDSLNTSTDEGKKRITEINSKINANTTIIKANSSALESQKMNVGNYKSALEGLSGGLGKISQGFKIATASIFAALAALKGTIEGIKAYVNLNREVISQTAKTAAIFKMSEGEARKLTGQMRKLGAAFDKDFNDVLKSSTILSKEFGISGSEAVALIEEGFKKGADVNGEFLELLKEYPAQLKGVGLSAEETIAIITQTEREGVFSDKGIDAIKEAGIRLRELTPATRAALDGIGLSSKEIEKSLADGSKTLFQVTQEVSGQLSKLPPQSAAVGTAIADIFGGAGEDAGLRFLTTLKDINTDLSSVETTLSKDEQATISLREAWEDIKMASVGTGGAITSIKSGLASLLVSVLKFRNDFIEGFNDLIKSSAVFRAFMVVLGQSVKLSFKTMKESVMLTIEPVILLGRIIKDALAGDFNAVSRVQQSFEAMKNRTVELGEAFLDSGKAIAEAYKGDNIDQFLLGQKEIPKTVNETTEAYIKQAEVIKKTAKSAKDLEDEREKRIKKFMDAIDSETEKEIVANKKKLLTKEIDERTFNQNILAIQIAAFQEQLKNAELTASERLKIESELVDQQLALEKVLTEERRKDAENSMAFELLEEKKKLLGFKGTQEEKAKAFEEFAIATLQAQIQLNIQLLEDTSMTAEERLNIESSLVDQQLALEEKLASEKAKNDAEELARKKAIQAELVNIANAAFDLNAALNERQLADLELQKENELALVGDNEEAKAAIEEDFARRSAEIKRKQAIADKLQALFNIAINTAQGITAALALLPPNPFLATFIGITGGIQAAAVLARPIPQFKDGVIDFEGGKAIVGEAGSELITLKSGETFLSPDRATMLDLPEGTSVIPHEQTKEIIKSGITDDRINELIAETRLTRKAIAARPLRQTLINQHGFKEMTRRGNSQTEWVDRYIKS